MSSCQSRQQEPPNTVLPATRSFTANDSLVDGVQLATKTPVTSLRPTDLVALQRMVGNRAVCSIVEPLRPVPPTALQRTAGPLIQRVTYTVGTDTYVYDENDWVSADNLAEKLKEIPGMKDLLENEKKHFNLLLKIFPVINNLDRYFPEDKTFKSYNEVFNAVFLIAQEQLKSDEEKENQEQEKEHIGTKEKAAEEPEPIVFEEEKREKKTRISDMIETIRPHLKKGGYAVSGGMALSLWEEFVLGSTTRQPNDIDLVANKEMRDSLASKFTGVAESLYASEPDKISIKANDWDREVDVLDEGQKYGTIKDNTSNISGLDVMNLPSLLARKKKQLQMILEEIEDSPRVIKLFRSDLLKALSDMMLIHKISLKQENFWLQAVMGIASELEALLLKESIMETEITEHVIRPLEKIIAELP